MIYIFSLVCLAVVGVVRACSPIEGWYPPSITERVLQADIVLYGRIVETYPDPHWSSAYTAEMEVFCTLKGPQMDHIVNLTEAGFVPGLCHSSNLSTNNNYVVLLRGDNGNNRLSVSDSEINDIPAEIAEVIKACGLQPVYPKGVDADSVNPDKTCPITSSSPSDCLNLDHFKRKPKPEPSTDEEYTAYEGDSNKFEKAEQMHDKPNSKGSFETLSAVIVLVAALIPSLMI